MIAPPGNRLFEPDLRNVNSFGVDYVMSHFFSGPLAAEFGSRPKALPGDELELICDEEKLDET